MLPLLADRELVDYDGLPHRVMSLDPAGFVNARGRRRRDGSDPSELIRRRACPLL
jgi:hypothetical protein